MVRWPECMMVKERMRTVFPTLKNRRLRKTLLPSLMEGDREVTARLLEVHRAKIRDYRYKMQHRKFWLGVRKKNYTMKVVKYRKIAEFQSLEVVETWWGKTCRVWSNWASYEQEIGQEDLPPTLKKSMIQCVMQITGKASTNISWQHFSQAWINIKAKLQNKDQGVLSSSVTVSFPMSG